MAKNNFNLNDYFDEKVSNLDPTAEELKNESLFEYDNFRKPATVNGLASVAQLVKSLLYLQPGTYPDAPSMGIGIENYLFEAMSKETLTDLQNKIRDQMRTYLPSIYIQDLVVKKIENQSLRNTIGIGFQISANGLEKTGQFFLLLEELPETREIISQTIV